MIIPICDAIPTELCQSTINFLEHSKVFKEATLNGEKIPHFRNNLDCKITDETIQKKLWKYVYPHIPTIYKARQLVGFDKYKVYALKYEPGQFFKTHTDGWSFDKKGNKSLLTVQIYLNGDFQGGETKFYNGHVPYIFTPTKGSLCIFDHDILHEGCILDKGIKYCLRFNVLYDAVKISSLLTSYMDYNTYLGIRYSFMQKAIFVKSNGSPISNTPGGFIENKYDLNYDECELCSSCINIESNLCNNCGGIVKKNDYVYNFRKKGMWMPK